MSINIILDRYNKINGNIVTVEAGIHLGHDPLDPLSTKENSLLYQLHHKYGLSLSDLGGISHQTVGGFLMTGSSGGSLVHGISDNVQGLGLLMAKGKYLMLAVWMRTRATSMQLSPLLDCLESYLKSLLNVTQSLMSRETNSGLQLRVQALTSSMTILLIKIRWACPHSLKKRNTHEFCGGLKLSTKGKIDCRFGRQNVFQTRKISSHSLT